MKMTPDQEKSMLDMAQATDRVLASLFGEDESPSQRICKGCGEPYDHPDPRQHLCEECACGGETCEWRTIRAVTLEDGTVGGTRKCLTCGKRKGFVE